MKTLRCAAAVAMGAAVVAGSQVTSGEGLALLGTAESSFLEKRNAARHSHHNRHRHPQEKNSAEIFREVDAEVGKIMTDGDAKDMSEYVEKLGNVEASLGSFANKDLMNRVGKMRFELCAEVGFQKHEVDQCESFMGVACSLDGAGAAAQSVSQEKCEQFFMEGKTEAEKRGVESSEETEEAAAEEEKTTEDANDEADQQEEPAAANATNGSNASGADLFGSKKYRALPEQGYGEYIGGKMVEHKDLVSHTEDWLSERDGRSKEEICKEFPNNQWCRMHMPQPRKPQRDLREVPPPPPEEPAPAPIEAPEPPAPKSGASHSGVGQVIVSIAAVVVAAWAA